MTILSSDHPTGLVYGQGVTFTAAVDVLSGTNTPTGSVQFQIDGTNFGSPTMATNGMASITISGLSAGDHSLAAVYSSDTTTFLASSASTTIMVAPAPLTITADNQSKVYGDPLPSLTVTYAGFVNGDTSASLMVLPSVTTSATTTSDVVPGGYSITASGAVDPNYSISYVNGTLTIIPANQTITWSNPADIIYGTALSSTQLDATVSVVGPAPAGVLTYIPTAGTVLGPGSGQVLTVTAAATNDYNSATDQVTINVLYQFSGFLPPLDKNLSFAAGRTLPIKFQLTDANGALITSLNAVTSLQVQALDSNGNPVGVPFNPTPAGGTVLHNDGTQYIYNWQTKGLAAGSYAIELSLLDGTRGTVTIQLTAGHSSAGMTTVAAGGTSAAPGGLLGGDIDLYVDNSNVDLTADELARIQDAVTAVDGVTLPYGVAVMEVNDPTQADVTLNMNTTSAVGGYAQGVLGCTTDAGQITIIAGWNFYASSDVTQIGSAQYDFQTVVTHELGHALGLGHSTNSTSVMFATLNTGTTNRALSVADLNVPDSDTGGACGLHATGVSLASENSILFQSASGEMIPSGATSTIFSNGHVSPVAGSLWAASQDGIWSNVPPAIETDHLLPFESGTGGPGSLWTEYVLDAAFAHDPLKFGL